MSVDNKFDIVAEFIEVLKHPNQINKEKRFELLEKCYLIKNEHPKYREHFEKINDSLYVRRIDAIKAMNEVHRLSKIKGQLNVSDKTILDFINNF